MTRLNLRLALCAVQTLSLLALTSAASATPNFNALVKDVHVHLTPDYVGSWQLGIYDFDNGIPYSPTSTILYVSPTGRTTQAAGAQWNFQGAGAGNNLWRTPQNPAAGIVSFSVAAEDTTPGTFTSYVETDPRVPAISQPWMKMSLAAVRGPGTFSLWQQSGSTLSSVWMSGSQSAGVDATDLALLPEGGHVHYYAAFSAPGMYELDFRGSGRIGAAVSQSAVQTYYVAVAPPVLTTSLSNSRVLDFIDAGLEHITAGTTNGLFSPIATAYDSLANVYVADVLTSRVMKYNLQGTGGVFADLADGVTTPTGLAVDASGNVFVANYLSNNIIKITPSGVGSVFADATDGLSSPFGLAVDSLGNVYAADLDHSRVLKINAAGVASVFADVSDGLFSPISLALDSAGNVFVADVLANRVMKFTPAGVGSIFADSADGLISPSGVAVDLTGSIYVSNYLSDAMVKLTPAGIASSYAGPADGISGPFGIAAYNPVLLPGGPAALARFAAVPEPSSAALALFALAALGFASWRKRHSSVD